ncbi:hypothetical protein M408DRAFT_208550 [Serendipita vermifera MAFF 305830]|uniref:Uncharacterized protein n=1 Tax=Serendipita vermifera MAFF 305830 TaxID=933852 RepID=A0A0C2X8M7_SERVB|nr:hypothetical protein M408DRAFT_208550 [Serendipita vermifera MAFF 305830]
MHNQYNRGNIRQRGHWPGCPPCKMLALLHRKYMASANATCTSLTLVIEKLDFPEAYIHDPNSAQDGTSADSHFRTWPPMEVSLDVSRHICVSRLECVSEPLSTMHSATECWLGNTKPNPLLLVCLSQRRKLG